MVCSRRDCPSKETTKSAPRFTGEVVIVSPSLCDWALPSLLRLCCWVYSPLDTPPRVRYGPRTLRGRHSHGVGHRHHEGRVPGATQGRRLRLRLALWLRKAPSTPTCSGRATVAYRSRSARCCGCSTSSPASAGCRRQERLEIRSWLASLPWIGGWQDALPPPPRDPDDDEDDGGIIELHFNW